MPKTNYFSSKMVNKSSEELEKIVSGNDHTSEAKLAAVWELENRNENSSETEKVKSSIIEKENLNKAQRIEDKKSLIPAKDVPLVILIAFAFYALSTIIGLSLFISNGLYSIPVKFIVSLISLLILGIPYMVVLKKNWARILLLVFYLFGLISPTISIIQGGQVLINEVAIFQTLLQLIALVLMFLPISNRWFKGEASEKKVNADLLDS